MLGLGVLKISFDSHQTYILTRRRQQTHKVMTHNINGDANFTNGLDKESAMDCDKKIWMLEMIMIHAS